MRSEISAVRYGKNAEMMHTKVKRPEEKQLPHVKKYDSMILYKMWLYCKSGRTDCFRTRETENHHTENGY